VVSWNWLGQRLHLPLTRSSGDLQAAQDAFARGDLDGTITLAREVVDASPDDAAAVQLLARALIYRSYSDYNRAIDRQSALEVTTEALSRAPKEPNLQAIHAYALQAAGQPVEAARVAERVLQSQPDNVIARVALSLSYGSVGSFEIALRESLRAVESAGQSDWMMDAQRAVAISYSDLGDYPNAIKAAEKAILLNSRLIPLYFERALYALQVGDANAATVAYFRVLAYDPENVKVRLRMCELSSTMREREAAIRYCSEVTTLAPEWSEGWYQLGREYFLQGDFSVAQSHFNRCSSLQVMQNVPIDERRFECWYLQGQAAEIVGDCDSLIAIYNEFRAMTSNSPVKQTWSYPPEGPACVPASLGR
jgi:tetratricopeptide (TPR) repeat protein